MNKVHIFANWLSTLQNRICQCLESIDGKVAFVQDDWQSSFGKGSTRILSEGSVFEKAGVNFSWVQGSVLPASASATRPELAGKAFEALGLSIVVHPRNPHVPTSHMNVRMFVVFDTTPCWWFGGGYDLTPYFPYDTDCHHWHKTAYKACKRFDEQLYHTYKQQCDAYFYLPHRGENRGIGGLFFDDLVLKNFTESLAFVQSVGESYLDAYVPIIQKRMHTPYTTAQRQFQNYRRGRYVEFNLIYDRGTLFGLQSGGRTESILMSMPPHASWKYQPQTHDEHEKKLIHQYLKPKDWLIIPPK